VISIPYEDLNIFEMIPGFKFKLRVNDNSLIGDFEVQAEEDVEYNLKFNKNSDFTFDNFENYIRNGTALIDRLRSSTLNNYIITIVIFNEAILKGTGLNRFEEGLFVVDISNESGKLPVELFQKFCKEYRLPHLKPLFKGSKSLDDALYKDLLLKSQISNDGRVYGLVIKNGNANNVKYLFPDENDFRFTEDIFEHERLMDEYVAQKASSKFFFETTNNIPLTNSTRVYNALAAAIQLDTEFENYRREILKHVDGAWIENNLRQYVKKHFKQLFLEFKKNKGILV
jgi:hypothetical protein